MMSSALMQLELMKFTEKDIQQAFARKWVSRYPFIAPNVSIGGYEADLFGIRRSGFCDEIEIKLTASDFKADFKKNVWMGGPYMTKHERLKAGLLVPNYFSFLIPAALEDKVEIPDYCGLMVYRSPWGIHEVKRAPRLHGGKISDDFRIELGRKMMVKYWTLSGIWK